jgi:hypothetical protein
MIALVTSNISEKSVRSQFTLTKQDFRVAFRAHFLNRSIYTCAMMVIFAVIAYSAYVKLDAEKTSVFSVIIAIAIPLMYYIVYVCSSYAFVNITTIIKNVRLRYYCLSNLANWC